VYLAMADEAFGRRVPFAFLAALKKDFEPFIGKAKSAIAYSFNREFCPVIKRQVDSFGKQGEGGGDKLSQVQHQVDQVKGVMVQNIEKVLEPQEHIDLLVDKAEGLEFTSHRFKKRAGSLRNSMWWQNQRFCIGIVALVTVIITIIIIVEVEKKKK